MHLNLRSGQGQTSKLDSIEAQLDAAQRSAAWKDILVVIDKQCNYAERIKRQMNEVHDKVTQPMVGLLGEPVKRPNFIDSGCCELHQFHPIIMPQLSRTVPAS
jgi:hypothetical protein